MDEKKGSEIPWMEDTFFSAQSTSLPEIKIIEEESSQVGTVVIFVISAIITITLLFAVAIFIDCRQEKLIKLSPKRKQKRKTLQIKIPSIGIGRAVREDENSFADKMEENEPSTSHVIV